MNALSKRLDKGDVLETFTGTATTAVATHTPKRETSAIRIFNAGDDNDLKFSIDGGVNFLTVRPGASGEEFYKAKTIQVKTTGSGAPTTPYEIESAYIQ